MSSNKKNLWKIHAWLGLYAGAFMIMFSITGSAIVFRQELDAVLNPALYRVDNLQEQVLPLDSIAGKIEAQYPGYHIHQFKFYSAGYPVVAKLKPANQDAALKDLDVFVDRGSGVINGARHPEADLMYWVTKLHTNVLAGKTGRYLVGVLGLVLLAMLITGLLIYGQFMKKKKITQVRWGKGSRKVFADWHKLIGISTLAFNLIWAVTGVTLAFLPYVLETTIGKPHESFAKPVTLPEPIAISEPQSYSQVETATYTNFPHKKIKSIRLSEQGHEMYEVKLENPSASFSEDASRLYIDKDKKQIMGYFDAEAASAGSKLFYTQKPLHYGTFGGNISKVFYAFLGLSSGFLYISGFVIYWKRSRKNAPASPVAKTTFQPFTVKVAK